MKRLWTYIDGRKWREGTKYRAALVIAGAFSGLAGLAAWLVVRNWALSGVDWMLCFIGYPVIGSWIAVFFYVCRHAFHDGRPAEGEAEAEADGAGSASGVNTPDIRPRA